MNKERKMTPYEVIQIEIDRAKQELAQAEQNFRLCDPDFTTVAILELLAKQKKLDVLYARAKKLWGCANVE